MKLSREKTPGFFFREGSTSDRPRQFRQITVQDPKMGGLAAAGEMQGVGEVHTLGMPVGDLGYGAGISPRPVAVRRLCPR